MIRDFNAYKRLLQSLLPRGRAWRSDDAVRDGLLAGEAVELSRVDSRMNDLLTEADVRVAVELLGDHETDYGLPDGCLTPSLLTTAQRQAVLLTKLRSIGRLNKQYYIDLAAALGYTIHINEFTPAWCGLAKCGDPCGEQTNLFYWLVNVHYNFVTPFTNYADLQCMLTKLKPVHTSVLFAVWGPGFSSGFSNGFLAMPAPSMTGGFSKGFNLGFAVRWGGGFKGSAFSDGFDKPFTVFGY